MSINKRIFNILVLLLAVLIPVGAADFGLMLDQSIGTGGTEEVAFDYQANLIPRFSLLIGEQGEFIASAGLTVGYAGGFYIIPELLRTEFFWDFGSAAISTGRINYTSPFLYLADGLFDGARFFYDTEFGTFSAAAFYTGLLYKKNAAIRITTEDEDSFHDDIDYADLTDTYFSSRRLAMAFDWEHPALGSLVRTGASVFAQFDLNGRQEAVHSQYLAVYAGIPVNRFLFELSGALMFAENFFDNKPKSGSEFEIGFSGEAAAHYSLQTDFPSRVSFMVFYSGGKAESGPVAAFIPFTTTNLGNILQAKPSGIMILGLDYTARLHQTFSAGLEFNYFLRTDLSTNWGLYPISVPSEKYGLGGELFGQLMWNPFSDLRLNLGGGIFIPAMGDAAPKREPRWRVSLTALLALY